MKHVIGGPIGFGLFFGLLAATASAEQAQPKQSVPADAKIRVQRFRMNPYRVNIGKITSVKADGTVQVAEVANPKFALTRRLAGQVDLTEGYYLGFVASEFVLSTKDTRINVVWTRRDVRQI